MRYERAVFFFSSLPKDINTSLVSSARIVKFLLDELGPDTHLFHDGQRPPVMPTSIGELWIVNSSDQYSTPEWRHYWQQFIHTAERVVFCQNDYQKKLQGYAEGRIATTAHYVTLSTIERAMVKRPGALLNWNVLTYTPRDLEPQPRIKGVYYYGALRGGREKVFGRYFDELQDILTVSASSAYMARKFQERWPKIKVVPKADDLLGELAKWKCTLILEDDYAVRNYVSPPNRFYEALSAPCGMLFDHSSVRAFRQGGFDITQFTVQDPHGVREFVNRVCNIHVEQCLRWRADHVGMMRQQFHELLKRIRQGELGMQGPPTSITWLHGQPPK